MASVVKLMTTCSKKPNLPSLTWYRHRIGLTDVCKRLLTFNMTVNINILVIDEDYFSTTVQFYYFVASTRVKLSDNFLLKKA